MVKDWTHKNVKITDIRKLNELYLITIEDIDVKTPLKINQQIFENRLQPYFLKNANHVSREEILGVKWNMYITKGYFIKIDEYGEIIEKRQDPDSWYVSYLEIAGELGSFQSVLKK